MGRQLSGIFLFAATDDVAYRRRQDEKAGRLPDLLCGLLLTDALLFRYGVTHLIGNAHARGPGAEDDHPEVRQRLLTHVQSGHDGGEGHASGALDVIVEAGDLGTVRVEQSAGCCIVYGSALQTL